MELLAPAGNTENFLAAMEAGADAVYVGAPAINARNLARDLRFEEIVGMVQYCRSRDKKIYLAANSLVREQDLSAAVDTLAMLEAMDTDGLIVQDLGLVRLIQNYFPSIPLHASTLLSANNSLSLNSFHEMGFERVVLARELTLKEIESLCRRSKVEIEVFVHGAMCFSYSGLCLFSSFLGGKSGLRGKCVQPCRRHYSWSGQRGRAHSSQKGGRPKKGQYLFSMNDLSGLEVVADLRRAGVASLKIEGRLRSANYVSHIVQAYRKVMDASGEDYPDALSEAKRLSDRAMGRSSSSGYFFSPQPASAITPHHSGNMGDYLGRLGVPKSYKERLYSRLTLKKELAVGDRLRLHGEPSGERLAFTLKEIRLENSEVTDATVGEKIRILVPEWEFYSGSKHIDVYRVDVKKDTAEKNSLPDKRECLELLKDLRNEIGHRVRDVCNEAVPALEESTVVHPGSLPRKGAWKGKKRGGTKKLKLPIAIWLRLNSARTLLKPLPFVPDRFLLPVTKSNLSQTGQLKKHLGRRVRDLTWCLPPVLFESDLGKFRKQIQLLIRSGFRSFQLGHITQVSFFKNERVYLSTDYTVSLLNSQGVTLMEEAGMEAAQLSIESDRGILAQLIARYRRIHSELQLGLTVYGAPALFTARLDPGHFQYDRVLNSPRQEQFILVKKENVTATVPLRPFSLLPYLHELKAVGLDYAVVDLENLGEGKRDMAELADRLAGSGNYAKLPTFNYLGRLE